MLKVIPRDYFDQSKGTLKLLWEDEWRGLGITQACSLPTTTVPRLLIQSESRVGALRSTRARASYIALQVSILESKQIRHPLIRL